MHLTDRFHGLSAVAQLKAVRLEEVATRLVDVSTASAPWLN